MKISIDSTEPLEDVMHVIGALYDVTLTVAPTNEDQSAQAPTGGSGHGGPAASGKTSTRKRGRGRSTKKRGRVNTAELRSWAQQNGHRVSDRGPIPATVREAYQKAQRD